jgi:hypothetical protein
MRKSGIGGVKASAPAMRDTLYGTTKQSLVWEKGGKQGDKVYKKGDPKGAQQVGFERKLWDKEGCVRAQDPKAKKKKLIDKKLNLAEMRHRLHAQPDFAQVQTILQDLHEQLGTEMTYAPKYHCELQEMVERAWGQSKEQARRHCSYSIVTLRVTVPRELEAVPLEMFRQWQRSEMAWEKAYREGATIVNVEGNVKQIKEKEYKSHRTMLKAAMPSAPRKKQFKATAPQNWAVNVDEVLEHVPTPEQEGWVQERRLMLDSTDGAIMRLVHVGWHEDQECVVFWYYEMGASDTRMPRAGPNKLDMF